MIRTFWSDLCAAPRAALVFGLGGLIPFIALTLLALAAPTLGHCDWLLVLALYAAVIVSFVGALHWGYAVKEGAQGRDAWLRYGWSVVPALTAVIALQLTIRSGLRLDALMIVSALLVDQWIDQRKQISEWMRSLRLLLTVIVATLLVLASYA